MDEQRLLRIIVEPSRPSPLGLQRLILFGTHARGISLPDSDVDTVGS